MVAILVYLCILEIAFAMWLSFPAVCSMVQSKVMRQSCYLLSFWLSGIRCIKVSKDLWSVRITNLCPLNWASKKCRLSIIANNSFWKVGYLSCVGLNFRLRKQDGLIASRVPSVSWKLDHRYLSKFIWYILLEVLTGYLCKKHVWVGIVVNSLPLLEIRASPSCE